MPFVIHQSVNLVVMSICQKNRLLSGCGHGLSYLGGGVELTGSSRQLQETRNILVIFGVSTERDRSLLSKPRFGIVRDKIHSKILCHTFVPAIGAFGRQNSCRIDGRNSLLRNVNLSIVNFPTYLPRGVHPELTEELFL